VGYVPADRPRPRNAAVTRSAILSSAIRNFARAGYDGVGVREIAGEAGVTAMLVNRYFGSKEKLFAEAVEASFASPVFIAERPRDLSRDAAAALVARSAPDADDLAPFLIMLRSASNPRSAEIVRDAIERHVGRRLAGQLPAPARQLRADVQLSVISGVLLMRRVLGTKALNGRQPDQLVELLEAVFDAIADAPLT
jgi:AcrR family transcriptional regulator